jgi:uncharacterized protein YjbI with pentapeptide repeats
MPPDRRASPGATEPPDLVEEELAAWAPEPLQSGFEIEDALVTADLSGISAAGGRIARSRLAGARLAGSRLRSLRLIDVAVADADLSNADWTGAQLQRVVFERCRMTGFVGASLQAEHVVLRDCKLDLANLRRATFRRATFEGCVLDDADLAAATVRDTRFAGCRMRRLGIDDARLAGADFRGSDLAPEGDVAALRGAVIDALQLVELGPLLARGLGIEVRGDA